VRSFRGCLHRGTHHQPFGLPLDHHLGTGADECHNIHLVLCEVPKSIVVAKSNTGAKADSLAVLTIGQAFEGVPWGLFIANSPAYASEIVPIVLRGACTATLQMSWSIGGIIVAAVTWVYNKRDDEWAWRIPLALQWVFPVSSLPDLPHNTRPDVSRPLS
jgi:MFS family permease